ncbi:hypothetical protein CVT26_007943 [Gymnopilus dilepis]|uniref:DNA 3'-5' helicase n=1 Tax=Gymnopilus dilepis TaxID=231916 RepID=A0A409WEM5_9AGAR|nr:hypothetical protein CVT26_007943 [Gymnopilus dilepis]
MATGAGKTGLFSFLMLVVNALSQDPSLAPGAAKFPKNPCMLSISPTKALEEDMAQKMDKFGLRPLVINADTAAQAREDKRDHWKIARSFPDVLILSPEELSSRQFGHLLDEKVFFERLCFLGIDEIHLLHWWGNSFREAFKQIGLLRARLPTRDGKPITLLGITATLRVGPTLNAIYKNLGLKAGQFHLIRRSNMRHDIQIIFREMKSGIGGTAFPELDWVLEEKDQTVIFCKTISLGFRVAVYLWLHAKGKGLSQLDN